MTSGKSVAERLQALKQPESGEHFLFTILKQIRGRPQMSAPIIDGFFALFHHYGFDFSSSCMKDIDGKSFSEVLAEHRLYPQLVTTTALLLQTGHCALPDPTFLPNFLKHHISQLNGSRTAKATESTVETGTFPLKAHLLELPGDIVREILVHCQYSGMLIMSNPTAESRRIAQRSIAGRYRRPDSQLSSLESHHHARCPNLAFVYKRSNASRSPCE